MDDRPSSRQDRDLVLPPQTYAYVLDTTKGKVSVYVGPFSVSLSSTDQLVTWDSRRRRFVNTSSIEDAIQTFTSAEEGQYVTLSDPAGNDRDAHPPSGTSSEAVTLGVGRTVVIPGPASFPLWPGQEANTIDGHHLRHNEFLVVRVVNPDDAAGNWGSAIVAPQTAAAIVPSTAASDSTDPDQEPGDDTTEGGDDTQPPTEASTDEPQTAVRPENTGDLQFTMGQMLVIRGNEVSFYMPSTGVQVVPEPQSQQYVRSAVTLEQLEYCILLDESGTKRYVHGPAVVFPEPTETFVRNEQDGDRKFRALELDERTGIYVKVIEAYEEDGRTHEVGDELFIYGPDNAIYYPRPEHSIITYDGRMKHHAIAIPAGEGRYVLNRDTGEVKLVKGPRMYLPDPRKEVVVRRVLDTRTVELLYPGNNEAVDVNARYMRERGSAGDGDYLAGEARRSLRATRQFAEVDDLEFGGQRDDRSNEYSEPRTLTLDTKYAGAVSVNIWPGYAVMVTNRTGDRRVEIGPKLVMLEYDETLMPLELSTGKPKTTDVLHRTVYLQTANNQVSDIIEVETTDLVGIRLKLSLRANFVGQGDDRLRWFDVENYVKVLTDHVRSRLRRVAKQHSVQEFYSDAIDIIRDALLMVSDGEEGSTRPGLNFAECGLHVYDVEVLEVNITDTSVAHLLQEAQETTLRGTVQLSIKAGESERLAATEALDRADLEERQLTKMARAEHDAGDIATELELAMARVAAELSTALERVEIDDLKRAERSKDHELDVARRKELDELELTRLGTEVDQYVKRLAAFSEEFLSAINRFGDQRFVEQITRDLGPAALASGVSTADLLGRLLDGTPFQSVMETLGDRPLARANSSDRPFRDDHLR